MLCTACWLRIRCRSKVSTLLNVLCFERSTFSMFRLRFFVIFRKFLCLVNLINIGKLYDLTARSKLNLERIINWRISLSVKIYVIYHCIWSHLVSECFVYCYYFEIISRMTIKYQLIKGIYQILIEFPINFRAPHKSNIYFILFELFYFIFKD